MYYYFIRCLLPIVTVVASAPALRAAPAPVTLTETADSYTLANDVVTAKISKRSAGLASLRYKDIELLNPGRGNAGYWSHSPGGQAVAAITIDPKSNNGDRAEVSVKAIAKGQPVGSGPGGSAICDVE